MADQINPMGGLAPGTLPLQVVAPKAQPAPAAPRLAREGGAVVARQESPTVEGQPQAPSPEVLASAHKDIQHSLQKISSELKYRVDEESGRVYFQVVSPASGEVLMQVPSDEVLAAARKLRALSAHKDPTGVLVDKQG